MESLKNKVVVVTGAGSGMGKAIARLFASKGSKVVASDLNKESLNLITSEMKEKNLPVLGVVADVSKKEDLEKLVKETVNHFGSIDILINNAGILDDFMTVGDLDLDVWQKVMDVNVKGPTILSHLVVDYWLKNKKSGVVINNASVGGMFGARGGVSYVSSKHAVIGLTKNIASVYRDDKIRCVAVAPGEIKTNIGNTIKHPDMKGMTALNEYVADGPAGSVCDVAYVIAFLASDEAKFINGTVVTIDGGWTSA